MKLLSTALRLAAASALAFAAGRSHQRARAGLAQQADPLDRGLRTGRRHRHRGARARAEGRRTARPDVIIENRSGAAGVIGADAVAKSPNDGYTLAHRPRELQRDRALRARQGAVRSAGGLHHRDLHRLRAEHPRRASVGAGQQRRTTDRSGEEGAGQADLRLLGHRQHAAPGGRAVQASSPARPWCTCPTRAAARRSSTSSPAR